MTQRITIIFEDEEYDVKQEASYERKQGINKDDALMWMWLVDVWTTLGLDFVTKEFKNDKQNK